MCAEAPLSEPSAEARAAPIWVVALGRSDMHDKYELQDHALVGTRRQSAKRSPMQYIAEGDDAERL
jgi:hypothetical protein